MSQFKIWGPIIVILQLIAVVVLTKFVRPFPPPPEQDRSNLTGLPVWEVSQPHLLYRSQKVFIADCMATVTTGITSLVAIYFVRKILQNRVVPRLLDVHQDDDSGSHIQITWTRYILSTILTIYVNVTFLALVAGLVFHVGKLWSAFGIFHNILEVALVASILQLHKRTFNLVAAVLVLVVYSVAVTAATSQLNWYWDEQFFKFQGLILDLMLPLLFYRVAKQTKVEEGTLIIENTEETPLVRPNTNTTISPPQDLKYLFFASLVHLIGNLSNVVGNNSELSTIVFDLSYLIAFPVYAYYVRKVEKTQVPYAVPETTIYDFILIFLWGTSASAIATLVGLYRMK